MKTVFERHGKPHRRRFVEGGGVDVVVNFTGGEHLGEIAALPEARRSPADLRATAGYSPEEDLRFIWTFELQIRGSTAGSATTSPRCSIWSKPAS